MNEQYHQRAERLILEARVEPITVAEGRWLETHLEGCAQCARLARSTANAIHSLRSVSIQVDPELVTRTRLMVRLRSRSLERQRSGLLPVWVCCGLSWAMGVATAPLVWRGFEWLGRRGGLPALVWEGAFVLWWALPALVTALLLALQKAPAGRDRRFLAAGAYRPGCQEGED